MSTVTDQPSNVRRNPDGSEYIPAGLIEETLDSIYFKWGTENHRFNIHTLFGNRHFASSTATLKTKDTEHSEWVTMEGSSTFEIFENDENKSYEATSLSFCISNAAKKKGIIFGRALNGRMDKGETSSDQPSVIQIRQKERIVSLDQIHQNQFEEAKEAVSKASSEEEGLKIAKQYGFSMLNPEIKKIIQTIKKNKNASKEASTPSTGNTAKSGSRKS
jgi:hypothetical protein